MIMHIVNQLNYHNITQTTLIFNNFATNHHGFYSNITTYQLHVSIPKCEIQTEERSQGDGF